MTKSTAQAYLTHQSAYATFGDTICSANQHLRVFATSDIHLITTSPEALLRSLYQMDTLSFRRYYCGAPQIRPRRSMEIKPKKLQLANLRIPNAQSMKATMASHATELLATSEAMKQRRVIRDTCPGEAYVGRVDKWSAGKVWDKWSQQTLQTILKKKIVRAPRETASLKIRGEEWL